MFLADKCTKLIQPNSKQFEHDQQVDAMNDSTGNPVPQPITGTPSRPASTSENATDVSSQVTNGSTGQPPTTPKNPKRLPGGAGTVVRLLRRAIVEREYSWNDQLPAERQMANQLGVSRGTVREALRRLEEMGLVIRKPGNGTFVRYRAPLDTIDIAEMTSPLELIDVRLAVEPMITRHALTNASARDLERLGKTLGDLEKCGNDAGLFSRNDEEFHLELAECTRNPLMIKIYRQINDVRGHTQWNARKDTILTGDRIRSYNAQHRRLYTALVERNMEAAIKIITEHLLDARRDLVGATRNESTPIIR